MAEDKKGFLMYADYIHAVEELDDDEAGHLFKTILRYVNDLDPVLDNKLIKIAFEPIKQNLKRDLKKYEAKKELWSKAGKASAMAKKASTDVNECQQTLTDVENVATKSTVNVNDNVTVNVNDTVNVIKDSTADKPPQAKFIKPELHDLVNLMSEKVDDFTAQAEAEKFFNYYQSNGWKVGGRAAMKDWKAAAKNWLNNSKNYNGKSISKSSQPFNGRSGGFQILADRLKEELASGGTADCSDEI